MAFEARLCRTIRGVEVTVFSSGMPVRALIPDEVLERRFGATDPQSWVAAYEANAACIDEGILKRFSRTKLAPVILHMRDVASSSAAMAEL